LSGDSTDTFWKQYLILCQSERRKVSFSISHIREGYFDTWISKVLGSTNILLIFNIMQETRVKIAKKSYEETIINKIENLPISRAKVHQIVNEFT
jgi:hypothetical protein